MKGMMVEIYQNKRGRNCSNGGVSSKHNEVILVGNNVPEIFEPTEKMPAVLLKSKPGIGGPYLYAVPIEKQDPNKTGYMFGGCFIYCSDSRFPSQQPIPLHDRQESWKEYQRLGD